MDKLSPNVMREEAAPCRVRLNIEVPQEQVRQVFATVEREYMKQAKIPGFRPGKAPRAIFLRQYGENIRSAAKERLLNTVVQAAVEQEGIMPITHPAVQNVDSLQPNSDTEFVFAVEFDIEPEFELPEYKGLKVAAQAAQVGDVEVEQVIDELLKERTSYEKVERPAQENDLVKCSYHVQIAAEQVPEMKESGKYLLDAENTWVALRQPEILPGISDLLTGVQAGESRHVTIDFPEAFYEKSLAGKSVDYQMEIVEVHAPATPELNDDMARQLGAESADDVRLKIRQNIESRTARERHAALRQDIVNQLLEKVDFALPPAMLAAAEYEVLMELYREAMQRGEKQEELTGRLDELRARSTEIARERLQRQFLLTRIAAREGIRVAQQEVQQMIAIYAQMQKVTPKVLEKRLRENGRIHELISNILENKTIEKLVELADIQGAESGKTAVEEK